MLFDIIVNVIVASIVIIIIIFHPPSVWEYTFAPREYLHQHLETRFSRALAGMVMYSPETSEIAKPSELLTSVRAYMNVLQSVENYVNIDITRVFNNVLLQQTQQVHRSLFSLHLLLLSTFSHILLLFSSSFLLLISIFPSLLYRFLLFSPLLTLFFLFFSSHFPPLSCP